MVERRPPNAFDLNQLSNPLIIQLCRLLTDCLLNPLDLRFAVLNVGLQKSATTVAQ